MDWRREARSALRSYPKLKLKQSLNDQQITPQYGGPVVQHEASRTTEAAALRTKLTDYEQTVIDAVEFAMEMQGRYYNAEARLKMMRLVYFRKTHTMQGAALEVEYNINTIKAWNTEVLTAVYVFLKRFKKD